MASEKPTSPAAEGAAAPSPPADSSSSQPSVTTTTNTSSTNAPVVPPTAAPQPAPKSPAGQPEPTGDVAILKEAFPDIEIPVIRAVLKASKGDMDAAFNALLSMSDPDFQEEPAPPPRPVEHVPELPPRRSSRQPPQGDYEPASVYNDTSIRGESRGLYQNPGGNAPRNQLEADELYARQLQEHYAGESRQHGQGRPGPRGGPGGDYQRRRHDNSDTDSADGREHSFLDDDLPVIKENIRQGFLQTQEKVNRWVSEFKKKIDGEFTPEAAAEREREGGYGGPGRSSTFGGTRGDYNQGRTQQQARPRYSTDHYDADPHVLPDDFAHLEIRDNTEGPNPPAKPSRPAANPGLMGSTPLAAPKGPRKVSFRDEEDDDDLYAPTPPAKPVARQPSPGAAPGGSKWEPLRSVEPQPMDKDPFSLGDSDDEDHLPGKAGKQESGVIEKKEDAAVEKK